MSKYTYGVVWNSLKMIIEQKKLLIIKSKLSRLLPVFTTTNDFGQKINKIGCEISVKKISFEFEPALVGRLPRLTASSLYHGLYYKTIDGLHHGLHYKINYAVEFERA